MALGVTIGRLAKAAGVNVQTIRYYERRRLLSPTARTQSGFRVYGDEEVRRLRFIKNAQTLGFTLHEIADLLSLRVSSTARCGDVQRRAQAKLVQVETKAHSLEALARALKDLVRVCRAGQPTDRCPILKSLEEERGFNDGNRKAKG
jgi:MerR family mercuric resistance operon transcriptional regulator/MerR family gold-responsive transcriptional activator of gol and ges genes